MNVRRVTEEISERQAVEIVNGYEFAASICKRLNFMLTIKIQVDHLSDLERCLAFDGVRKRLTKAVTRAGAGPLYAAWAREVSRTDGREHLHALVHLPERFRETVLATLRRWYPAPEGLPAGYGQHIAPAVETVHGKVMWKAPAIRQGRLFFGPGYLLKSSSLEAAIATSFNRVPDSGGLILGKRAGVTRNIAARAIATWTASRPSANIIMFPSRTSRASTIRRAA